MCDRRLYKLADLLQRWPSREELKRAPLVQVAEPGWHGFLAKKQSPALAQPRLPHPNMPLRAARGTVADFPEILGFKGACLLACLLACLPACLHACRPACLYLINCQFLVLWAQVAVFQVAWSIACGPWAGMQAGRQAGQGRAGP